MGMLHMGSGGILGKMKNPYPSLLMVSLTLHSVIKMIQSTFMLSRSIEYLNSYLPRALKSMDSILSGTLFNSFNIRYDLDQSQLVASS